MDTSHRRILVAHLNGAAQRFAGWEPPTGTDREQALNELRAIAGDNLDALAETAGIMLGAHPPGDATHHLFTNAAQLLLEAGGLTQADVQQWIEVGKARREKGREAMRAGDHWARSDF